MQRVGTVVNPEYNISLTYALHCVGLGDSRKDRNLKLCDAGDIPGGLSLEEGHSRLRTKVGAILAGGAIPFVVGGGNDQSFPNGSALLDHAKGYVSAQSQPLTPTSKVGIINIDAHLDVRPLKDGKAHSGSPFRQLLEDERFSGKNFVEFAAQGNQCSADHVAYIAHKARSILPTLPTNLSRRAAKSCGSKT